MNKHIFTGIAVALALGSTAASAQIASNSGLVIQTNQSLLSANIGNGINQSQSIVSVVPSGKAALGVGALSGSPSHYGSTASVSALNTSRLLGVDGPAGRGGAGSVSLKNPKPGPVLSSIIHH